MRDGPEPVAMTTRDWCAKPERTNLRRERGGGSYIPPGQIARPLWWPVPLTK